MEPSSLSDPGSFSTKVRAKGDSEPDSCNKVVWMCVLENICGLSCLNRQDLVFTSPSAIDIKSWLEEDNIKVTFLPCLLGTDGAEMWNNQV